MAVELMSRARHDVALLWSDAAVIVYGTDIDVPNIFEQCKPSDLVVWVTGQQSSPGEH